MSSVASNSTEFQLFRKLANPLKVDFKNPRPKSPPPSPPLPEPNIPFSMSFSDRLDSALDSGPESAPVYEQVNDEYDAEVEDEEEDEEEEEEEDEAGEVEEAAPAYPSSYPSAFTNRHPTCVEEIQREKQGYLLELEKWKMQGITTTKQFSMNDSLDDIQFEYDRIKMNMDTVSGVNFMKDAMKLMFTGVELANSKMGPILQLDGWSSEVTSDMQKYNNCLEKIYKKHWRKGSMAPESELAFMVVGSMLVFHFKAKFFGNVRSGHGLSLIHI